MKKKEKEFSSPPPPFHKKPTHQTFASNNIYFD